MNKIIQGDCLEVLKTLDDNSIDSIVTDPPYELGFMGKSWDSTGIAYNTELWKECLRVLKPGGHLLAFSGTRTYHRMACAIEDAGFEIRDQIQWIYGSGFPKSLNIGKAVDKLQGNEREVLCEKETKDFSHHKGSMMGKETTIDNKTQSTIITETKGNSPYEGWGTALKPAHEPICVARKPLSEKTVAENCLKWGTGGINIDGCRIDTKGEIDIRQGKESNPTERKEIGVLFNNKNKNFYTTEYGFNEQGRFPANVILDEEAGALLDEQSGELKTGGVKKEVDNGSNQPINIGGGLTKKRKPDKGGASRFFYCAKASKSERNKGLEGFDEVFILKDNVSADDIKEIKWLLSI